jgi:nucleoside-diphosphate-sugar epimerase
VKALLTGSAGFVGTNLLVRLCKEFDFVYAIDDFNGLLYDSGIKARNYEVTSKISNLEFRKANLENAKLTDGELSVDYIINLAALPGQALSWENLPDYSKSNLLVVWNLLEQFKGSKMPKWIQASTSSVYGATAVATEKSSTQPNNPYGITKLAAENLLLAYSEYFNLEFLSLRFFSIYGPNQRPDMGIFKFIDSALRDLPIKIYGDGQQSRDVTYIDDVVESIILACKIPKLPNLPVNVSGGTSYTVNQIVDTCLALTKSKSVIHFIETPIGDQLATENVSTLAYEMLGYSPRISLEIGLANQASWMQKISQGQRVT